MSKSKKQMVLALLALILVFGSQPKISAADTPSVAKSTAPIVIEADQLYFNDASGDLFAEGNVHIEKGQDVLAASKLNGNTKIGEVWSEGQAALSRPGMNVIGQSLRYNYQRQTGKLGQVKGTVDRYLVSSKSITVNPEHSEISGASLTTCPANVPDYHISATRVEIWPGDKMVAYNAKFWIKNTVIFSLPKYQTSLKQTAGGKSSFPRLSYSTATGVGIAQYLETPVTGNVAAFTDLVYYSKSGFKPEYGLVTRNPGYTAQLAFSHEKNSDDEWLKKEPEFSVQLTPWYVGKSKVKANVILDAGKWREGSVVGWRNSYSVYFAHDSIRLSDKTSVDLGVGFQSIFYGYDHSRNNIFHYDVAINTKHSDRLDTRLAYYHRGQSGTSPYEYDRIDISRELAGGFMAKVDRLNSIGVTVSYDLATKQTKDVDYTWRHNLHCWEVDLTYREKRDQIRLSLSTVHW